MLAEDRNKVVQEALHEKRKEEDYEKQKKREVLFSKRKEIMQLYKYG